MSKWIKNIKNQAEADAIIEARKERIRQKQSAWVKANRDKANAYKRAYKAKKKEPLLVTAGVVIKYTYRPNWKEAPVYYCPELTYRGMHK